MIRFVYPAALAVLALLLACSGDDDGQASPSSVRSGTATASPSPSTDPATPTLIPATELTIGDPVDFPDDVALIVETVCWYCEGPASALVRVYRRPDGSIAQDILFTPDQLDLPPDDDDINPYILGFAVRPNASELAVALCVTKHCRYSGLVDDGSAAKLYRSTDGGVTWAEWGDWPRGYVMIGLVADGVLAGRSATIPDTPDDPPPGDGIFASEFIVVPGGRPVEPPADAIPGPWPVVTELSEVWWPAEKGRLLRDDGSVALTLPHDATGVRDPRGLPKSRIAVPGYSDSGNRVVSFYRGGPPQSDDDELVYVTTVSRVTYAGPLDAKAGYLYGGVEPSRTGIPLPTTTIAGFVPVMIDLHLNTAHPITSPFLDATFILPEDMPPAIVAFQQGPFARVTGTGSCLNLRAEPSLSAEALTCLADGVLLFADSRTTEADGVTWLQVLNSPSFPDGWVSTEFLER